MRWDFWQKITIWYWYTLSSLRLLIHKSNLRSSNVEHRCVPKFRLYITREKFRQPASMAWSWIANVRAVFFSIKNLCKLTSRHQNNCSCGGSHWYCSRLVHPLKSWEKLFFFFRLYRQSLSFRSWNGWNFVRILRLGELEEGPTFWQEVWTVSPLHTLLGLETPCIFPPRYWVIISYPMNSHPIWYSNNIRMICVFPGYVDGWSWVNICQKLYLEGQKDS